MNTKRTLQQIIGVVILLLFFVSTDGFSGNRSGSVTGQFLKLPLSARAVGMGGAQVALAQGAASIGYNPAGMMSVTNYGVGINYTSWFAGIDYSYAGATVRLEGIGNIGVGMMMLATDEMKVTTNAFPEGDGRTFRASEYAISFAYSRQVTDQFVVGVSTKIIRSSLFNSEYSASTFAFDIGTLYDIPVLNSRIGVSLTNIGKDLQYIKETYSLPTALRFGVLYDLIKEDNHAMVTTLQVTRLNDADEQYNVGAEYSVNNLFALRGGWKFAYDQENVTGGFGIKLESFGVDGMFDYGYNNFTYLPGTHSFTFEMQF
ncbi:MAG: PorV/PorQ family protein [Ignavibacteriae bacterium]|nr:PorV/PorQ family protein [Ignavibacteriota bacterium]